MSENQAPKHTVTVRHTVHFRRHHLGPTRLLAYPSHRSNLPARTILRRSGSYVTHFGPGHSTRTTRILSRLTNVELVGQHSVSRRKTVIVTSPSSSRRYQSPISPSRVRSPKKRKPVQRSMFPGSPLSTPIYASPTSAAHFPPPTPGPSSIHSPQPRHLGGPTPSFLNIDAPTPPQTSQVFHYNIDSPIYHDTVFLPPVSSSFPILPVLLHPELTSYCPLLWSIRLPPTTARSRYPISYPFDLDFLSAPACPGAAILLIRVEGGSIANAWTTLWGPIRSVLRPNSQEITVFDVLEDIHTYLHARLSLSETKYVSWKKGYQELVDAERHFWIGAAACEINEWNRPPKRLDVIAPLCGGNFVSLRYDGVWQMGGLELSLRLGWL